MCVISRMILVYPSPARPCIKVISLYVSFDIPAIASYVSAIADVSARMIGRTNDVYTVVVRGCHHAYYRVVHP